MTYERARPSAIRIPGPEFQCRAAELLRELGETPAGKVVVFVVEWVQLQLELERQIDDDGTGDNVDPEDLDEERLEVWESGYVRGQRMMAEQLRQQLGL